MKEPFTDCEKCKDIRKEKKSNENWIVYCPECGMKKALEFVAEKYKD